MVSETEAETMDLDWFATDANGCLGRFTTGGQGFLPAPVMSISMEQLREVGEALLAMTARSNAKIHDQLGPRARIQGQQLQKYSDHIREWAVRGIFCFDCIPSGRRPTGYFLAGFPIDSRLSIDDVPESIHSLIPCIGRIVSFDEYVGRDLGMEDQ